MNRSDFLLLPLYLDIVTYLHNRIGMQDALIFPLHVLRRHLLCFVTRKLYPNRNLPGKPRL